MDAQPIEPDAVLSRAEVAEMLCVGPKTVARWAKAGSSTRSAPQEDSGVS